MYDYGDGGFQGLYLIDPLRSLVMRSWYLELSLLYSTIASMALVVGSQYRLLGYIVVI